MHNQGNIISVISVSDDKYSKYLGVMIYSLFQNNTNNNIRLYVIDVDIRENNLINLKKIANRFNRDIIFFKLNKDDISNLPKTNRFYSNSTAFCKLFAPNLLYKRCDKVLYIDADTIINNDISKLNDIDLGTNIIGSVLEPYVYAQEINNCTGIKEYFNSGVMLIDINSWVKNNITEKVIEYSKKNIDMINFMDQDGLNYILKNKWLSLSPRYNLVAKDLKIEYFDPKFSYDEIRDSFYNTVIVHFVGKKPSIWHHHPYRFSYYKYLIHTPWIMYFLTGATFSEIKKYYIEKYIPSKIRDIYQLIKKIWRK